MILAMVAVFGGMAAMMGGMMASGVMGPGHMWGWGGSTAPQTPVVAQATAYTVEMRDFAFWPSDLTVSVGTRVTWVNRDDVPHDATADDGAWGTQLLNKGDEASLTFDTPETFSYHCTIHPQMKATLTVR